MARPEAGRRLLPFFAAAAFLGAFLLFWIQPLFAKRILPLLGGSPAVWNTALVFFQGGLLAGYLYVHLTTRWLPPGRQLLLHLALFGGAVLLLPIGVPEGWSPPAEAAPAGWLLALLTVSIGLPFFALSATAPLVQRWFAMTDHPRADDPYFLYAASNLGSLGALLAFPVLLEPNLGLLLQSRLWSAGFAGLALLLVVCGAVAFRIGRRSDRAGGRDAPREPVRPGARGAADPPEAAEPVELAEPPEAADAPEAGRTETGEAALLRLRWVLLAAVPASLLLGVTSHISTDLASFPLLWIVPLVLYLLTYIAAFARRPPIPHRWMLKAEPYVLLLLALSLSWGAAKRLLALDLALHLVGFFVIAMVCHRELAERRPPAGRLTEFYLWLSLGGALGGAITALAAPLLFDAVVEYPLALVAAAILRPASGSRTSGALARDLLAPAALAAVTLGTVALVGAGDLWSALGPAGATALFGVAALVVFHFVGRPLRFGLGLGALLLLGPRTFEPIDLLARERSFFGVHRVARAEPGPRHLLLHGTTLHGVQQMAPGRQEVPLLYYAEEGPAGQLFRRLRAARPLRAVGAVGLGAGALACYREPDEVWTFFEIDPLVVRIARDTALFRYLELCGGDAEIVLGDGRLSLRRVPDGAYDLLILDAFSSDAIPVHLLTAEAFRLYASKLRPGGILLVHISNRYLHLSPVLANVVAAAGLVGRLQDFSSTSELRERSVASSTWAAVARRPSDLEPIAGDDRWEPLRPDPERSVWTDDFSNLLEALRLGGR